MAKLRVVHNASLADKFGDIGLDLPPQPPKFIDTASGMVAQWASDVKPTVIHFLWWPRLAIGKHSLFAGIAGRGKSQVIYKIAAHVTASIDFPDGGKLNENTGGTVILLNAEDGTSDMMVPRLISAGANLKKVAIVKAVRDTVGKQKKFNLLADLDNLHKLAREMGDVQAVGIDPLGSYIGGDLDTHHDAKLRSALDPLSEFADSIQTAIASVAHFNKNSGSMSAMMRVVGGVGFVNAPRAAFAVLDDPSNGIDGNLTENGYMLVPLKSNLGPMAQGLRYKLEMGDGGFDENANRKIKATHVTWNGPTDLTADAIMASERTGFRDAPARREAEDFLGDFLSEGPKPVAEVRRAAKDAGIASSALRDAKEYIGVKSVKPDMNAGWQWELPDNEWNAPYRGDKLADESSS